MLGVAARSSRSSTMRLVRAAASSCPACIPAIGPSTWATSQFSTTASIYRYVPGDKKAGKQRRWNEGGPSFEPQFKRRVNKAKSSHAAAGTISRPQGPVDEHSINRAIKKRLPSWLAMESLSRRLNRLGVSMKDAGEYDTHIRSLLDSGECDISELLPTLQRSNDWNSVIDCHLFRQYLTYIVEHTSPTSDVASRIRQILAITDLRYRPEDYPETRQMHRHFHLHIGPTNSGKTYNALKSLVIADTGAYAGPLRLLAHEAWERINRGTVGGLKEGRECNLLTGEERRIVCLDAGLIACTVEMMPLNNPMDVVVIDEIQMMADPQRGSAWTTAIMGVQAKEVHLCGEETVIGIIQEMVDSMGDTLTIHRYERLTPLAVAQESLDGDLGRIEDGDCVVSFSRTGIFNLKKQIEQKTGKKCAVVYGALPPETRAEQAKLFNEEGNGVSVMVASDAVGMGLNLKIKRIIFEALRKYNGVREVPLSVSQIKQIAGRAGRFGQHDSSDGGSVTTLQELDRDMLKQVLSSPLPAVHQAYLDPSSVKIHAFSMMLPENTDHATLLDDYKHLALTPSWAAHSEVDNQVKLSEVVEPFRESLSLRDMDTLTYAPVNTRDENVKAAFTAYLRQYVESGRVDLNQALEETSLIETLEMVEIAREAYPNPTTPSGSNSNINLPPIPPAVVAALPHLESLHKSLVLYIWLSFRMELVFSQRDQATALKERTEVVLEYCLERLPGMKKKKRTSSSASRRHSQSHTSEDTRRPLDRQPNDRIESKKVEWLSTDRIKQERARTRFGSRFEVLPDGR